MGKKKFTVQDTIKFIDIDANDVTEETKKILLEHGVIYRDQIMKEHLLDPSQILDGNVSVKLNKQILTELTDLYEIMGKKEAAYMRLITP